MNARQRIQAARTELVLNQPFFGALALRLRIIEDPSCPTAYTDGRVLGYNPAFIDAMPMPEVLGVIAHEVMHCANGHPWRRDSREPLRWNFACDYAINFLLMEVGFKLPQGCLRDAQYDGKSSEWIYDRLPQMGGKGGGGKDGQGDGSQRGPGCGGQDVRDANGAGAAEEGQTETDWRQAVQQAAAAAKSRGQLPSQLARFAEQTAQPKVNWRSVLHRFVQTAARTDYSWRTPNPRYLAGGLYLPALRSEEVGAVAVAIDTSGSIDNIVLSQFAAELRSVCDDVRPSRVHVIYCDAAVHGIETFERDDKVELRPKGGGGTDFRPAIKAAELLDEPPVCLIYLTDLMGAFPDAPPSMPVLWATIQHAEVPFGEVVDVS